MQYLQRSIQNPSRQEVSDFWKVASMGAVLSGGIGGLVLALFYSFFENEWIGGLGHVCKKWISGFSHDVVSII
jgi:hypothetical protein